MQNRNKQKLIRPILQKRAVKGAALAFLLGCVAAGSASLAEPSQDKLELERLEQELEAVQSNQAKKAATSERLKQEADTLSTALIGTAARIRTQEDVLIEAGQRVTDLLEQEQETAQQLADHQLELGALLGAMQTLERQRPPALLVSPDDAVKAVQSAILLDEIVPKLIERADRLAKELLELRTLKEEIVAEQASIAVAETKLEYERQLIERLLSLKIKQQTDIQKTIAEDERRIAELAQRATTLKALIQGLDDESKIALSDSFTAALRPGDPNQSAADRIDENRAQRTVRLRFSDAKGSLQMPVNGSILVKFGASNPNGDKSRGVTLETRENAQVIVPFDGKIVFAGPFMDYEQLLLIEAGDGYHMLLTGMARIYGKVGDRLLAGEPVGGMGVTPNDSEAEADEVAPKLYLELRKNGDPINPLPWLASTKIR